MVAAFAAYADVQVRLNRTLTSGEQAQVAALLDDASTALRDAIGWQVYPAVTATLVTRVDGGRWLSLPPATSSVASVSIKTDPTLAGVAYGGWEVVDGGLYRHCGWPCGTASITATFGYAAAPDTLKRWAVALAGAAFAAAERTGGLGGGVTAVAIDDFRAQIDAAGGASAAAMDIPPAVVDRLRASFGLGGALVVGERS